MDQMLKQRLIGAIVIIALAVIFVPMILEKPDKELSTRTQSMPPPPTIDYQSEVGLPVPAGSAESPEPAETPVAVPDQEVSALPESAETAGASAQTKVKPAPAESPRPPTAKPTTAKQTAPERKSPAKATSAAGRGDWVLQVGSFTQQTNAQKLRDRLTKAGYRVSVQVAKSADGSVHRVLVGPVSDRPAAERLRDKLAREQKLTAMVLENK